MLERQAPQKCSPWTALWQRASSLRGGMLNDHMGHNHNHACAECCELFSTPHHGWCDHRRWRPIEEMVLWAQYWEELFLLMLPFGHQIMNLIVFTSTLTARKKYLCLTLCHFLTFISPFPFFFPLKSFFYTRLRINKHGHILCTCL